MKLGVDKRAVAREQMSKRLISCCATENRIDPTAAARWRTVGNWCRRRPLGDIFSKTWCNYNIV